MKIAVLGAGSWGTSLAILLARNGHDVHLFGRDEDDLAGMAARRENLHYLPGFAIPEGVSFERFGSEQVTGDIFVLAVPSGAVREVCSNLANADATFVIASKGLEAPTGFMLHQVVLDVWPNATVGVLSGPNLAIEIARGIPTVAVAAFDVISNAERVQSVFGCGTFRVSVGDDVIGVELAGALKNVLAIGAGMSDSLGFGDNTKGAFLSRGLLEMSRLGLAMGAKLETFLGPAGVGDLFATAASTLSRNYRLGRALGEGSSLGEALTSVGQVAEGVPTSEAATVLARRLQVQTPVFAAVESVILGRIEPRAAVAHLMERSVRMEHFLGGG